MFSFKSLGFRAQGCAVRPLGTTRMINPTSMKVQAVVIEMGVPSSPIVKRYPPLIVVFMNRM